MKTLLIISSLFAAMVCSGQSLVHEHKLWSNTSIGSEFGSQYESYFEKFEGDTLINGMPYKHVLRSFAADHSAWQPFAFIREDIKTQQVFLLKNHFAEEVLLYDFSLEQGDSIDCNGEYVHVKSVTYKYFGKSPAELKHIEFVHKGHPSGTWVEGVGSLNGLLSGVLLLPSVGGDSYLVCYSEDGVQVWQNAVFKTCFPQGVHNSKAMIESSPLLSFYTNNGHAFFQIESFDTHGAEFSVLDIMGRTVKSLSLDCQSKWAIPLAGLSPGIYIYRLRKAEEVLLGKFYVH